MEVVAEVGRALVEEFRKVLQGGLPVQRTRSLLDMFKGGSWFLCLKPPSAAAAHSSDKYDIYYYGAKDRHIGSGFPFSYPLVRVSCMVGALFGS